MHENPDFITECPKCGGELLVKSRELHTGIWVLDEDGRPNRNTMDLVYEQTLVSYGQCEECEAKFKFDDTDERIVDQGIEPQVQIESSIIEKG